MKNFVKSLVRCVAIAGMLMMSMPMMATNFDIDEVVVDGIKYGIVGSEAPYKAYVVEYVDWDDDDFYMYKGEITVPSTIEFESGKEAMVVGIDDSAFDSSPVTMVTLPNSVETIGKRGFAGCSQLTCIKIGNGIKEIKSKAFSPDAKLTTMYIDAVEPPVIASDALMINSKSATLFVPSESVDRYRGAEVWKEFGTITTTAEMVPVAEIVVTPANATVAEMGTIMLSAAVYPAEAQQKVSWTSSDPSVARVSGTGEVFGVKSGVCIITASATDGSGVKGECALTVGSGKLLQVNMPFISGFPGEKFNLRAEVAPQDATVAWTIEDETIASIDAFEKLATVKLLAPGKTVITISASNGLSQEIEVNVKELVVLTGIDVDPSTITCEVGDQIFLSEFTVTPVPENASAFNPDFKIEDTSIVDYDPEDYDEGTFVCLAPGTTRFVWTQDGINGYCTITVNGGGLYVQTETEAVENQCIVFSIDGTVVKKCMAKKDIGNLPAGFYIINGKKYIKRYQK